MYPKFGMGTCQLGGRFADIVKALNSHEHQLDRADADLLARGRSHPMAGPRATTTAEPNTSGLHMRSGT